MEPRVHLALTNPWNRMAWNMAWRDVLAWSRHCPWSRHCHWTPTNGNIIVEAVPIKLCLLRRKARFRIFGAAASLMRHDGTTLTHYHW